MKNLTCILLMFLLTQAGSIRAINLGDAVCSSLLLVSNWSSDNVKIFDGCSGSYIRDLDSQGLIKGPLGIIEAPDGDVLVFSEANGILVKFDYQTLSVGTVILGNDPRTVENKNSFISKPTGGIIDINGFMYVASFDTNKVVKIDTQTWQIVDTILYANNGHINGIDAGMTMTADGHLLLPGFNSDNIIKVNVNTKSVTELVAPESAGLDGPRTILLRDQEIVVTGEKNGAVMVFDYLTGNYIKTLVDIVGPTGLIAEGNDHFIVNNYSSAFKIMNDGTNPERIISTGAGGLSSGTFIYRLQKKYFDENDGELSNDD